MNAGGRFRTGVGGRGHVVRGASAGTKSVPVSDRIDYCDNFQLPEGRKVDANDVSIGEPSANGVGVS